MGNGIQGGKTDGLLGIVGIILVDLYLFIPERCFCNYIIYHHLHIGHTNAKKCTQKYMWKYLVGM